MFFNFYFYVYLYIYIRVGYFFSGDWLLRFLYRTLSIAVDGVAGLQEIDLRDRRMVNIDLTEMVSRHSDYPERMDAILSKIGIPVSSRRISITQQS